ncbi:MAG: hypothetical protein AAF928_10835 [Myxococcota bacterium]
MKRPAVPLRVTLVVTCLLALVAGCAGPTVTRSTTPLDEARRAATKRPDDAEVMAAWMLAELIAPKGDLQRAEKAKRRLEQLKGRGEMAMLARALDHDVHGRFSDAVVAYLAALDGWATSPREDAALFGWFVAHRLVVLREASPGLWDRAEPVVAKRLRDPGHLGWRARATLIEWWSEELFRAGGGDDLDAMVARVADTHGCLREASFAGPFGRGLVNDHRVQFEAERPAPWPARFPGARDEGPVPRVFPGDATGCFLRADGATRKGVYYAQSFIELDAPRDLIIAVQGAYMVSVDDHVVLERDAAAWGVWPRFGVRVRLAAGRHRVLARLLAPETSIRVLQSTGTPAGLAGSALQGASYTLAAPEARPDPNALEPFVRDLGVAPVRRSVPLENRVALDQPVLRYIASYLAHIEGQDDLASVLIEPLVDEPSDATGAALAQQAVFVDNDPIFAESVARDLARDLRERAADKDPRLWGPQLWLRLNQAEQSRPAELARSLEALATKFPQVPVIQARLAQLYGQLGWKAERVRALEGAAVRFPTDLEVLESLHEAYAEAGRIEDADRVAARIRELDPTNELAFRRALARRDYDAAIAELRRIGKIDGRDREMAVRIADLMVRAGRGDRETIAKLSLALENAPTDEEARLALADAKFAQGDRGALQEALVDALETGSSDDQLRYAIELVEGMTDLEPYRRDGRAVIAEVEQSGESLPGSAARILDYGAIWVAPDGSARMLEHEVIRLQSAEGIARHVEQNIPRGVILRMRTIKKSGEVFEPELVAGKPTVTMPHLEVGDYIETESILVLRGATEGGRRFLGPRWFFREENVSYHTSEFVVILPSRTDQLHQLIVETTGDVPAVTTERSAGLVVRRWTVNGSRALVEEPLRPPITEFLPSVRVGWGIDLDGHLERIVAGQAHVVPRDPRLVRIVDTILSGALDEDVDPSLSVDERARRIYRWVVETIEPGKERSGPKIVTGKSGDRTRAFLYLCRLAGIDARIGLVRDRLAPPPRGPISEAETAFTVPAVRVGNERGGRWLVVGDRYTPYGFLPDRLRGQPAVLAQPPGPITRPEVPPREEETTSAEGADNVITHDGAVTLAPDGSATLTLEQAYEGRYAITVRSALSEVLASRRKDVIEAQVLGPALPGGRVTTLDLPGFDELDRPARLKMGVEVPNFARVGDGEMSVKVPFLAALAPLVSKPERETPLYIGDRATRHVKLQLEVALPPGAKVLTPLELVTIESPALRVIVRDRILGDTLMIDREVELPAGRIQPEGYPAFVTLVRRADDALNRIIRIGVRPAG